MGQWKASTVEFMGDVMGFAGQACLRIDSILLAVFSVWFVAELLWHLGGWLSRELFSGPW